MTIFLRPKGTSRMILLRSSPPGIRVQYLPPELTPGTQLDFDYRADVQFFADHSSQNDVAHRLSLTLASPLAPSLDVRLRKLFVVTEDQFARDERLSNPTGLRPVSDQRRARTIRNEADGGIRRASWWAPIARFAG